MMLNIENISDVYALFLNGMMVGALLSGLPFLIGYGINALIKIAQDSN